MSLPREAWWRLMELVESAAGVAAGVIVAGLFVERYNPVVFEALRGWQAVAACEVLWIGFVGLSLAIDELPARLHVDHWDNDGLLLKCSDRQRHEALHGRLEDEVVHR